MRPSYRKGVENQHVRHTDQDPEGTEDEFLGSIFGVNESSQAKIQGSEISTPAIKVPIRIEDVEVLMEVDTGAGASVMSYADYERNFKYLALRPVNRSFHAYTGTPLDVAGQVLVDVGL